MSLTHEELEKYIEQVCSSAKIVCLGSGDFVFKYPTTMISMKARLIYEAEYQKAIQEGLLPYKEMKKLIEERHLISESDQKALSSLKSKLGGQKVLLAKTTRVRANQDRIKKVIEELEIQIREIEYKERSKLTMTAETKAEEAKLLYLCWACTYNFTTEELQWKSDKEFMKESNFVLRQDIISEFMSFYSGVSTTIIREIARSSLWRIRYITSVKTSDQLFGRATTEYSGDMLNLAYWSHFYQNIYEMMPDDQPPQDIIEDDMALDAYMEAYYKERSNDNAARRFKKRMGSGRLSAFDSQEVIVTRANELYEDIEYDKPREAQAIKDRTLIKKKANNRSRAGQMPDKLPRR